MFRCYGCSPPDDPPHGSWDCDLLKNGDTVCMLQCEVDIQQRMLMQFKYYKHRSIHLFTDWIHH